MKKNNTMRVLIGMLCVSALMSATAFAATGTPVKTDPLTAGQTESVKQDAGMYSTKDGIITKVSEEKDCIRIETKEMVYNAIKSNFVLNEKTGAFMEMKDLKEGMKITAILSKNAPTTFSLPPQTAGAIGFVVRNGEAAVTVDVFNQELINQGHDLKLNIGGDTKIVHRNGAKRIFTAEDVKGSECLILNTIVAPSMPAQTTPHFIMILNTAEELKAETMPKNEAVNVPEKNEKAVISYGELRAVAEAKGYQVTWTSNTKPIVLTKDNMTVEITVGSPAFTFTHATKDIKPLDRLEKMAKPTKLENGKVMVSSDFLEALV